MSEHELKLTSSFLVDYMEKAVRFCGDLDDYFLPYYLRQLQILTYEDIDFAQEVAEFQVQGRNSSGADGDKAMDLIPVPEFALPVSKRFSIPRVSGYVSSTRNTRKGGLDLEDLEKSFDGGALKTEQRTPDLDVLEYVCLRFDFNTRAIFLSNVPMYSVPLRLDRNVEIPTLRGNHDRYMSVVQNPTKYRVEKMVLKLSVRFSHERR